MALLGKCYHEIAKRGVYGGAVCVKCDNLVGLDMAISFGWYCPESPDHTCHYFSKFDKAGNKYVNSINGEKIILKGRNVVYETRDSCLFCGDPDERK